MSAKICKKHELDAGYRQRISAGTKERMKEPAVLERFLEACRDPVRRAKISASRKGRNNMSEALLERVSRAKSKLAKDICMIRKLHFQGLSIQILAREYGVSFSTMSRAIRGIRRAYKDGAPTLADVQEAIDCNRERGARKRRRLKDGDVAELFRMRAAGVPLRRIAVKFQVTHRTVMNILSGRIYRGSASVPIATATKWQRVGN
jgi:DNA invertase Pin-like site-specific DNA recombinase